ncbi:hypothetical protein B566_EDAN005501 [Ephemera danica]|nr:hypothetical protein B566_EDAN005501 [Ephemera danica]
MLTEIEWSFSSTLCEHEPQKEEQEQQKRLQHLGEGNPCQGAHREAMAQRNDSRVPGHICSRGNVLYYVVQTAVNGLFPTRNVDFFLFGWVRNIHMRYQKLFES